MTMKPRPVAELELRKEAVLATADAFSDEFLRWLDAAAREHCSNYLIAMHEPKDYLGFLHMVTEATRSALLWAIVDAGFTLPSQHVADAETRTARAQKRKPVSEGGSSEQQQLPMEPQGYL